MTAGQLSRPVGHMSSTVQCSEINGETVCRRRASSNQNSFGIGSQQNKRVQNNALVPFSQPQASMSMRQTTTTTTPRPQQGWFKLDPDNLIQKYLTSVKSEPIVFYYCNLIDT